MRIGILALQGAVEPHALKLRSLNCEPVEVRTPADLIGLKGIILPGGESSAMIHLLKMNHLWEPLKEFTQHHPTWGLCAGAILLANKVFNPEQQSLGRIDIDITRNGFGRQIDSFIDLVQPTQCWARTEKEEAVFIRSPRITQVGPNCDILFRMNEEPVMVKQNNVIATTFHPELAASDHLHQYFIEMCNHG